MIYPTRAAIMVAAAGAPVALLIGVLAPDGWYAGLAWPLTVMVLSGIDALRGAELNIAQATIDVPDSACVGEKIAAGLAIAVAGARFVELALETGSALRSDNPSGVWLQLHNGQARHNLELEAVRRGTARITRAWLRWQGPFGLMWKQREFALDASIAVLPDIRPVRDRGMQLIRREALDGVLVQQERAEGADFDSLVEFRAGMDRRAIDWRQSARHLKLHAREYRAERNNQIVFAVDSGRQMAEPVAGLPRLDRVVSAMLLTAWIAIRMGDRVALHSFDSRPRIASGLVSGAHAFAELQRLAARIDYSDEETNYTFALTRLAARLMRRSLVVLFTEFTDPTSAEFLVRATERLMKTHLLMVVVLRDDELEGILSRAPETSDDVTRTVTAAALLKDRLLVLSRLRHLGAHVIESSHDKINERLVAGYADLKRRNLI